MVGRLLPGGIRILDLVSVGGMGKVYRAEQQVLNRTVAVKVIHPHLMADENSAARFLNEARAASLLNHPNSVSVIDFGQTDDGRPYLVMEFLRGKDLGRVAHQEGPLPLERIGNILRQVLLALADAHELGIIHRDLKPENILLESSKRGDDRVKVVDFGLAKLREGAADTQVTSPGIVCGTPDYMAPEQGRGDAIDGRADLYAVGVILYELLTGQLPFQGVNPTQVVMMHLTAPVPDPRRIAPSRPVHPALASVLFKALEKSPDRRFQDALEFADALDQVIARHSQPTPVPGAAAPVPCPRCSALVPPGRFCGACGTALRGSGTEPVEAAPASSPLPLVGRGSELTWLGDCHQRAASGLVGARVVGPPGAGKTRLLREVVLSAREQDDLAVWVAPDPARMGVFFFGLRSAIEQLIQLDKGAAPPDVRGEDDEAGRALRFLFGASSGAEPSRRELLAALSWALRRGSTLSHTRRVVVGLDDFDALDTPSRRAFADLVATPNKARALIVAAQASNTTTEWPESAASRHLQPLERAEIRVLVEHASANGAVAEALVANGSAFPMYVEQALRLALENGGVPPRRLADVIGVRVAALPPNARRLLQAVCLLGVTAERRAVSELVGAGRDLTTPLQALEAAGMIRQADGTLEVTHPLVREIVLATTPAAVRRDLHTRANRLDVSAPVEVRAQHAFNARETFQALFLLEQVANRARRLDDPDTAVHALRQGLELAREEFSRGNIENPLRAVLIFSRKLGEALAEAGQYGDASGVLKEALDLGGPGSPERARLLHTLARVARQRGRREEAQTLLGQALSTAQGAEQTELVSAIETDRASWTAENVE